MLVVEFNKERYNVDESSGFVAITVIISGGSSTTPISVLLTTTERSATGDTLSNN